VIYTAPEYQQIRHGALQPGSLYGAIWFRFHSQHLSVLKPTRSSAITDRPARRSISVEILAYCCTNNANRSRVSLSSTFATLCSATCIVLYVHRSTITQWACDAVNVINILPYHQPRWRQMDRNCYHLIRLPLKLLITSRVPPPAYPDGRRWTSRMD